MSTVTMQEIATKKMVNTQETFTNIRSFKYAFFLIIAVIVAAFVIQKSNPELSTPNTGGALLSVAILAIAVASALIFRKPFFHLLTSHQFAIAVISTTLFGTVLGTLILQNAPPEDYEKSYGNAFTGFLRWLFLTDIFHSLWFNGLLVLTALSLLMVLVKRKPFRLTQIGFLFSHLGIIVILTGALIGTIFGEKGFIDLYKGQSAKSMVIMKNGARTGKTKEIGFILKLDDFQVDYYLAPYKIYAYKRNEGKGSKEHYETIASYLVKDAKGVNKIPGTDISFKITRNNLDNEKADRGIDAKPVRHILRIEPEKKELTVKVGQTYELKDGWKAEVVNFLPHFSYNIQEKKAVSLSDQPENPALQVRLFKDGSEYTNWLFAKMPDFSMFHKSQPEGTPHIIYIYDAPFDSKLAPSIDLDITTAEGVKSATLKNDFYHPLYLEGGNIVLVLDKKEEDVKDYRSVLSVWDGGKEVVSKTVEVNAPLEYKGFLLYQSNYNPKDLRYAGILVVKDPGIWLVYVGFVMLALGVVYIFYIKPRINIRKAKPWFERRQNVYR